MNALQTETGKEKNSRRPAPRFGVARLLFSLFYLLAPALWAGATTVTGAIQLPDGTPVSGTLEFTLSQRATTTTPPILYVPDKTTCAVTAGAIAPGCTVQGNDTLDPAGTFYRVRILDANNRSLGPIVNYTITGTTVDLGALPVTATATLAPPDGSVTGNLNVTGNLTVGGSADFGADPQEFDHLRLRDQTADPATAVGGSLWHRSDLNRLRLNVQGLQLFDGAQFIDITAGTNSIDIGGDLKVGGGTDLGGFADLKCGSEPAPPSGTATRLYCLTSDQQYFFKDTSGVPFGPLASVNRSADWSAAQNFKVANNVRFADQFPGADAGAKMRACIDELQTINGGTCDARGLLGAQAIAQDLFAGVSWPVKLLLGTATYSVSVTQAPTNINFQIHGQGRKTVLNWTGGGTTQMFDISNSNSANYPIGFFDLTLTHAAQTATNLTYILLDKAGRLNIENVYIIHNETSAPNDGSKCLQIGTPTASASTTWVSVSHFNFAGCSIGTELVGAASAATNQNHFVDGLIRKNYSAGVQLTAHADQNLFLGVNVEGTETSNPNARPWIFKDTANENKVFGCSGNGEVTVRGARFESGATGNEMYGCYFPGGYEDLDGRNLVLYNRTGLPLPTAPTDRTQPSRIAAHIQFGNPIDATSGGISGDIASPSGGIGIYGNLLVRSEEFDHAAWNKGSGASIAPDTDVAPDGTTTADTINTTVAQFGTVSQNTGVAADGSLIAGSIWARASSPPCQVTFTLTNNAGTTALQQETHTLDTRWRRYYFTGEFAGGTTGNVWLRLDFTDAGCSIVVWGAQLLNLTGLFPFPGGAQSLLNGGAYVATGGSSVTVSNGLVLNQGVFNDGRGFKHARIATGSIAAGDAAAVTLTWTTPFPDTNYTIAGCQIEDATAATLALRLHHIESRTVTGLTVRIVNDDGAAVHSGTLHCTAVHD